MPGQDEFRFKAHELLMELDASISKMMMMVSSEEIEGAFWEEATLRHREAFTAWHGFLNSNENALGQNTVVH